ncbi:PDR/VanB family oxidoreductase [Agreia sp. VKM Ac-1783]|uniref:PDR/VanB family oxidoreductase n=1 Tax=Agreia sp. VKM Ac-1783 TaxID=1938889 RepID=UPI000A2AB30E|nr:PDR/VanB family oxidoreductase [Agreia sp. VKM Ac-1783]SMQ75450.1 phthalate 4,5-dioxygenase, reductase subunit [Agreia sp. VKM Ac-1783]
MSAAGPADLTVVVTGRRMLTAEVCEFELRRRDGGLLEQAEPGAHITVHTPSGEARSYSLTSDLSDRSRYVIAVRRDGAGRGGSRSMVDEVTEGDSLTISSPRNAFELVDAPAYLLVAAGIGITPIRAMLIELRRRGVRDVQLVYASRSREDTPYLDELTELVAFDEIDGLMQPMTLHHRFLHGALDWWPLLESPGDRHLYVCGPEPLQNELRALTMHWRPSRVHMEDFAGISAFGGINLPFDLEWQPSGATITVPEAVTMLAALEGAGIDVDSSCDSGTCGTCRLRLIDGEADHRDVVLTESERRDFVMPCVSRAKSGRLVVAPL